MKPAFQSGTAGFAGKSGKREIHPEGRIRGRTGVVFAAQNEPEGGIHEAGDR